MLFIIKLADREIAFRHAAALSFGHFIFDGLAVPFAPFRRRQRDVFVREVELDILFAATQPQHFSDCRRTL